MYRSSNSLGCLVASAWKIGENIRAETERVNTFVCSAYNDSSSLSIYSSQCGDGLYATTKKVSSGLIVSVSPICTLGKDYYLNVSPNVVWITPDMISDAWFEIQSNVDWSIV